MLTPNGNILRASDLDRDTSAQISDLKKDVDLLRMKLIIPEMLIIPSGTFKMGSAKYSDEQPVREVKISSYRLGLYEVTNAEYRSFLKATKQDIPELIANEAFSRHPVINVNWYNADDYCKWHREHTGRNFRLPTEAEWEYAARGPKGFEYPWGNKWDPSNATFNTRDNSDNKGTAPVDAHPEGVSWCGVYDMSGNVWEWTADWYAKYDPKDLIDPKGPECGTHKVLRGGSWGFGTAALLRAAYRTSGVRANRYNGVGFRVAEDIR